MTGGPRGPPSQLDLQAIEARLEWYDAPPPVGQTKHYTTEAITLAGDVRALLAHARALREALTEMVKGPYSSLPSATENAVAVLAGAQDGPALDLPSSPGIG